MEEQGSNHGVGEGGGGSILVNVAEWKSKGPTMVGVREVEVEVAFWLILGMEEKEQGSNHGGGEGGGGSILVPTMVWMNVDVGECKSKAPTMVWVREVEVAFWLMLRNGRARVQPWWG